MPPSVEWLISSKKMPQRVGESLWPGLSASTGMLAAAHAERGMAAQAAQVIESPRFLAHCEYLIVWRFPEYCENLPPQQHLMPFRGVGRQRPQEWQSPALPPPRPGGYARTAAGSRGATECPRTAARTADIRGGRRHAEARSWPWCGLGVALGWLCTPESMPSICLLYGFAVALGGFARPNRVPRFNTQASQLRQGRLSSGGAERGRHRLPGLWRR